jgi:hypothetical protein
MKSNMLVTEHTLTWRKRPHDTWRGPLPLRDLLDRFGGVPQPVPDLPSPLETRDVARHFQNISTRLRDTDAENNEPDKYFPVPLFESILKANPRSSGRKRRGRSSGRRRRVRSSGRRRRARSNGRRGLARSSGRRRRTRSSGRRRRDRSSWRRGRARSNGSRGLARSSGSFGGCGGCGRFGSTCLALFL